MAIGENRRRGGGEKAAAAKLAAWRRRKHGGSLGNAVKSAAAQCCAKSATAGWRAVAGNQSAAYKRRLSVAQQPAASNSGNYQPHRVYALAGFGGWQHLAAPALAQ